MAALATPPGEPPVARPPQPPRAPATAAEVFGTFEKRVREARSLFVAYVREVTRALAALHSLSEEDMGRRAVQNFVRLFGLDVSQ